MYLLAIWADISIEGVALLAKASPLTRLHNWSMAFSSAVALGRNLTSMPKYSAKEYKLSIDPETNEVICSCGNRTSDYDHEGFNLWDEKGQDVCEEEEDARWVQCLECDEMFDFVAFKAKHPNYKW